MSSGTKTTLRELNDEEVRRRRYPARPRPHTHRAPFLPRSPTSIDRYTLIIDPTRPTKHPQEYLVSKGFENADLASCVKYLRMIDQHKLRRPNPVYRAASLVVNDPKKAKVAKQDLYTHMEQLAIASLDVNDADTCDATIDVLREVFPNSSRVARLEGMSLEAKGRCDEAITKYDKVLEEFPSDQRTMKRKVAAYIGAGRDKDAIDALSKYLDTFMADVRAWEQLAGMYQERGQYAQSVFCWEEVIASEPSIHYHHRRLAEVLYTMGGDEDVRAARKYYAAAVDMSNATDVRALYGLALCDARIRKKSGKGKGGGTEVLDGDGEVPVTELGQHAAGLLKKMYTAGTKLGKVEGGMCAIVEGQLKTLLAQ